jgi:DNA-binding NtrC family response regulator
LRNGHLRDDLYYRLQANVLRVPSVRERQGDIGALAAYYLDFFNHKMGRHMATIGNDALTAMNAYSWPGNVREIANTLESAFTFGRGPSIAMADLPVVIQKAVTARSMIGARDGGRPHSVPTYAEVERELFSRALANSRGNRSEAAKLLQVSRKKLYDKIVKYHLA